MGVLWEHRGGKEQPIWPYTLKQAVRKVGLSRKSGIGIKNRMKKGHFRDYSCNSVSQQLPGGEGAEQR